MALKFKVKDKVEVIAGKDKGRQGEIEKVFPRAGKVIIPGINIYKRHLKGGAEQKAGRYDIPRPLDWSKIMLICPKCNKKTRVGFKTTPEGKVRYCRRCRESFN